MLQGKFIIQLYSHVATCFDLFQVVNRPGVAGAILQTPLPLIKRLSQRSIVKISSKHSLSQTIRAGYLTF